jgi:hypothetical protein
LNKQSVEKILGCYSGWKFDSLEVRRAVLRVSSGVVEASDKYCEKEGKKCAFDQKFVSSEKKDLFRKLKLL